MTRPYFSVVTPSWNQGAWIGGCIESVLAQGVRDFEHIVYDNCSSDETPDVLARYPHLRVYREPDQGQSNALNKGFAQARGEIICWLNADDQYLPGAFAAVRAAFERPEVFVVFGDCEEDFCDGTPPRIRKARWTRREDLLIWWEKRTDLLQPSVFFRRSLLDEVGPLREDLHVVMDTEFWWRVSEKRAFTRIDAALARQQRQPDSKTVKHMPRIYEEKAKVFGPLLEAAEPGRRAQNAIRKRRGMGRRWLGLAQSATKTNPGAARDFLRRARQENPLLILSSRWWRAWSLSRPRAEHSS
jgi:glycosyltransferase involved in cell wall biosynthesis